MKRLVIGEKIEEIELAPAEEIALLAMRVANKAEREARPVVESLDQRMTSAEKKIAALEAKALRQ